MKKILANRLMAMVMVVCMVLAMAAPVYAIDEYYLELLITENMSVKPSGKSKVAVGDKSGLVGNTTLITPVLVQLLSANFEGDAKDNKSGLWDFESDTMGRTIEAGLSAYRKNDSGAAWDNWLVTFGGDDTITGAQKDSLVSLLRDEKTVGDMTPNTEYKLTYIPGNTVQLAPGVDVDVADNDPAKGNVYVFTLILVDDPSPVNVYTEYAIDVSASHATVTTSHTQAPADTEVTVNVDVDAGYELTSFAVKGASNSTVSTTNMGGGVYKFTMPAESVTVSVTTQYKSGGGGGSRDYAITVDAVDNGTATADAERAGAGKKITVTTTANEGYEVDTVKVLQGTKDVAITDNGDGTYSFTMPAGAVTVTVTFKAKAPSKPSEPGHSSNCPAARFDDVDLNEWYHEAIDYVVYNGLMVGVDADSFGPDWELSRAMCAQIFFNLEGQPAGVYDNPFPDVAEGKWYYNAITWAFAHGVVSGYGDGLYRPEQIVTREELVQIYCNYAKAKGWSEGTRIADLTSFVDYEDVAPWHEVAVSWGVGSKLLGGKGGNVMAPKVPATRAEAAQMLMNMCKNIKK